MSRRLLFLIFLIVAFVGLNGCAFHYYNNKTGAEHIFGFGHMVMKATTPEDDHKAIMLGTDLIGFGFGQNKNSGFLTLGWNSNRRIEIIDKNTTIDLLWPNNSFLNVRIKSSLLEQQSAYDVHFKDANHE
ncbi:hypothetical protein [Nitrosomonas aestuarii]|uniref:hypothetical protein n=1 Tax=Nitrosomonas aestuarii TaxID=52441 RepID=UPI000D317B4F|nr:hypothetical protein [Nitrosomonas aestuarii]PTN10962.1 hypothetical protein C8R11_11520 [Nitrosomonas aestuarii]